ncbi:hypothetical protein Tco_0381143, partial [Tanacetum coccineum]
LCHEYYSTYEFDKVCADNELQTKKIIKFRLSGRAHSLTLLEFARRLGLYHADEFDEKGFDESHFNYQEHSFEGDSQDDYLWLVSEDDWVCQDSENDLWLLSMFDTTTKMGMAWLIARYFDTTTLRESTDSEGRLIPEDPQPGVPRVGIPRPPRVSMQDLYDRMGSIKIRQEATERMEYRQSYH